MTVHFIGAGPGRGRSHHRARARSDRALPGLPLRRLDRAARTVDYCPPGARIVDTAPLSLDEIEAEFARAHAAGP